MIRRLMRALIRQFRPPQPEQPHFPAVHDARNEITMLKVRTQILERVVEQRERSWAESGTTADLERIRQGGMPRWADRQQ